MTDQTFSTNFRRDLISWIDFGAPDATQRASDPIQIAVHDDYFWSVELEGIRIGEDDSLAFAFETEDPQVISEDGGVYSIFDTAAPRIYISQLWFNSFTEQFYGSMNIRYETRQGVTFAQCDANYPNLYFMVEGFWIQIPREEYLTVLDDDLTCRLQIQQIDTPFNILGMPFFMDYYISHDNDLGSMAFAPQKDSTKAPL